MSKSTVAIIALGVVSGVGVIVSIIDISKGLIKGGKTNKAESEAKLLINSLKVGESNAKIIDEFVDKNVRYLGLDVIETFRAIKIY